MTVPIVVAGALGVMTTMVVRPWWSDEPLLRAPEFVGNCDRQDEATLTARMPVDKGHWRNCYAADFGQVAALVTIKPIANGAGIHELHILGAGMHEVVKPRSFYADSLYDVELHLEDLDGDGIDEIIVWAPAMDIMAMWSGEPPDLRWAHARVVALRNGELVMSHDHTYLKSDANWRKIARSILATDTLTAEH